MDTACRSTSTGPAAARADASVLRRERTGIVFDVREFTVHDGPGIRTTVFLKGCPLRCAWCHNPEGFSRQPQVMRGAAGERTAGRPYRAGELATRLKAQAPILREAGGVTFSGGEPLLQAPFVADVVRRLEGLHVAVETCGYGREDDFRALAECADLILFGLKLIDPDEHARWTGRDNAPILRNLRVLGRAGRPFTIRVPLVPGVTDTEENLGGIARAVRGMDGLRGVELLPYNRAAGAKYAACGLPWRPAFDETRPPAANLSCFQACGVEARLL